MSDVNERELVRWLSDFFDGPGDGETGIGDDAALLDQGGEHLHALTIDTITEGRHFHRDRAEFREIGYKAAAVSLSDLAAMGAQPETLLVSTGFEGSLSESSVHELFEGIRSACDPFDCSVVGGDLYETGNNITITTVAIGSCPHGPLRRSGLSDGDALFVSGQLGGSLAGRHLTFTPRVQESLSLARNGYPVAMMDVSDGLVIDLDRMLNASSQAGAVLQEGQIPVHPDAGSSGAGDDRTPLEHALYDGEDFELLFGVSPDRVRELEEQDEMDIPLTRIGVVDASRNGILLECTDGSSTKLAPEGYEHF